MKKQLLGAMICNICLYLIQFLLIPAIAFDLVIGDNSMIAVLFFSTVILTAIGVFFFTDRLGYWLIALIIYVILIFVYSPPYAYDIGVVGLTLDGLTARYDPDFRYFGILLIALFVLLLQFGICLIAKLYRHRLNKRLSKND